MRPPAARVSRRGRFSFSALDQGKPRIREVFARGSNYQFFTGTRYSSALDPRYRLRRAEWILTAHGHRPLEEAHDRSRIELLEDPLGVEARGDAARLGAAADDPVVA